MNADVQKIRHGLLKCEAGVPNVGTSVIQRLPYCDKRARWLVSGAALCGGCKKKVA